jgi:plasmid stabilization system protein ParE
VEVIFAPAAVADLVFIRGYIGRFNPAAARRMADRIKVAAISLADFPERGRPIGGNRRELSVVPPYVIRYRIKGRTVQILRIWHGAQSRGE